MVDVGKGNVMPDADELLERGYDVLRRMGQATPTNSYGEIAPDFALKTVRFVYGDIMSGPALDLRSREIAMIAALVALGHHRVLRQHFRIALNLGFSHAEIVELITQMVIPAGWPAATDALRLFQETLGEIEQESASAPTATSAPRGTAS